MVEGRTGKIGCGRAQVGLNAAGCVRPRMILALALALPESLSLSLIPCDD